MGSIKTTTQCRPRLPPSRCSYGCQPSDSLTPRQPTRLADLPHSTRLAATSVHGRPCASIVAWVGGHPVSHSGIWELL